MSDEESEGRGGITAIARAVDILNALADANQDLTLSQLAEVTRLPRSTVHRIVQTLVDADFVASERGHVGVRLGHGIARLAAISHSRLVPIVHPFLEELSHEVEEGASLAVLDGSRVRFLDQAIAGAGLRAVSLIGSTFPSHCTANGKVLLSAFRDSVVDALLPAEPERYTARTIVDRPGLHAELARVREAGVAFDREEHQDGICAIGAIITDSLENRASITIALPAYRFYGREETLATALRNAVERMDRALSFAPERA